MRTSATKLAELIGKRVIIGITRCDEGRQIIAQEQVHGVFTSIDTAIHIRLATGEDLALPPSPESFQKAAPGHYRLRSTGEVIVNPDYTSTWTFITVGSGGQGANDH